MAILKFNPMAYIKYFALNAPMLIAAFALMGSAFNQDLRGLIFTAGQVIIMAVGRFISSALGRKVPPNADLEACNMFNSSGWGFEFSAPAPNALFLAYAFTYITAGMFFHSDYNWFVLGALCVVLLVNAFFRVQSLHCGQPIDVLLGWAFGLIWAIIWYFLMTIAEGQNGNQLSLTYFNGRDNGSGKCKLINRKFKCKKIAN